MNNIEDYKKHITELESKINSYEQNEKMFQTLVETAVGDIGEDFFNNIVAKLSEWLNAECIIIGLLIDENTVQGYPMYLNGEIIENFTYHLKNTPCDLTSKKGYCEYRENVRCLFPDSKDLNDLDAQGYVGTALYNKNGEANGILCAISKNKLQLPPQAENILRIVGARITAEFERKKINEALSLSENNLKKANASKDKFFSIIAHDLRSPFNSLIGFSEMLIKHINSNKPDRIDKYATLINNAATQTLSLLNNLLEWSMSQTGILKFNPVKFDIFLLVENIVEYAQPFCIQKIISIQSNIKPKTMVYADKQMIETILRNFISNAIKYSNNNGSINISSENNNNKIIISVTDKGIGMTDETINNLFNLVSSKSNPGTLNEKGFGIGLVLCKEFAEKNEGEIWVKSNLDSGSTFNLSIPKAL